MQYDDVIAAMFEPSPDGAMAPPTVDASPARRLRDAIEPIAMHSVWCRGTNERLAAMGHDFMTGYVSSRAALLGDPSPGVVVSSFAVFEPSMLAGVYQAGRAIADRDELLAARDQATIESLTSVAADLDIDAAASGLRAGMAAASGAGRPLFSGLSELGWPDSTVGQLWRAAELFREHRGDSHIAACVAAGLDAVEMNIVTELYVGMPLGTYSASRAWDETALHSAADRLRARGLMHGNKLSEQGSVFRSEIEHQTDRAQQSIVDEIGQALDHVVDACGALSTRCIQAGAFPPDVFKRAAG